MPEIESVVVYRCFTPIGGGAAVILDQAASVMATAVPAYLFGMAELDVWVTDQFHALLTSTAEDFGMPATVDPEFPCSLIIDLPLPTTRLASSALQALQVDKELSPLVSRSFSLIAPADSPEDAKTTLRTEYKATTNRMLRVAVNGFIESLTVVLAVMEELDVDVLEK